MSAELTRRTGSQEGGIAKVEPAGTYDILMAKELACDPARPAFNPGELTFVTFCTRTGR